MSDVAAAPASKTFAILEVEGFTVSQPFAEGHICTAAEAKVLNQTRKENLGNLFRSKVQAYKDGAEGAATSEDDLRAAFAEADASYQFTIANVGGGSGRSRLDPVEREARTIARNLIKDDLSAKGRKITDVPEGEDEASWADKVESEIERISQHPDVIKMAQGIAKAKSKSVGLQLSELGLGGDEASAAA